MLAYAKTREPALRDELVSAHLGLAEYLARRFANRGEPLDDLVQVASLGSDKGGRPLRPGTGSRILYLRDTYHRRRIEAPFPGQGLVDQGAAENARAVPPAGQGSRLHGPGARPLAHYRRTCDGRQRFPRKRCLEALEAGQAYRSASLDVATEEGESLAARLGEEDPSLEDAESRATLSPLLAQLPPRERLILHLRFFDGLTQSEIANRLQISQMHVSRLLARSLAQLRAAADSTAG